MLCCRANSSTSSRTLGGGYWCSKERSCGQRTSNIAFLSAKKGCMAGEMILVSTDIVVVVLGSSSVLLDMTNIVLQSDHFLTCR